MAFTQFSRDMDIISRLSDTPNVDDGLTPAQLKEKFDEGGKAIKEYINNVLLAEAVERPGFAGLVKSNGRIFLPAEAGVDYQLPMGERSVSRAMLGTDVTPAALGAAVPSVAFSVTIPVNSWGSGKTASVSVSKPGLATGHLIVSPHPNSFELWVECGVRASGQGESSLTFACTELPDKALTANVLMVG